MSNSSRNKRLNQSKGEGRSLDRRGVLQSDEQRPSVPVEFLLAFTRAMVRITPSTDAADLAMMHANEEVPLTTKQKAAFKLALIHEKEHSCWPKGFFS